MKRLIILAMLIQAGCSACSNKGGPSDVGDSDTVDSTDDDTVIDEIGSEEVTADRTENVGDPTDFDVITDEIAPDLEPEVYTPDCTYLDYPAIDLGTLVPTTFTPSREPTDCGERCRQVSFGEDDLEMADYDVWGNRLIFSNRNIEDGAIIDSRIYIVNLLDSSCVYFSRDDIFEKIATPSENRGALGWVAIYEDNIVFIRMSDSDLPDQIQVDIFLLNLISNQLLLVRTYVYPCPSCSSSDLDLFGNYVVFSDEREFLSERISLLNISTREECDISIRGWGASLPEIFGNKVVFHEGRSGYGVNVYVYDIEEKSTEKLTNGPGDHYSPHVWDNIVVWSATRNGGTALSQENADVYMMDLSTSIESPVCTHPASQPHPAAVWGTKIVWPDCRNDPDYPNVPSRALNWDLYMYDVGTGIETQLTSMPEGEYSPKMHQDKVYFIMKDSGNIDSIFEITID